ncbi:hypothetical protein DFJ58DRAFT_843474 [Suillus subalutaceus]|uniref:uncharacterized protein n=1 Tax=Suillus subalutaceus TaxID=48586 RepID=UPI001B870CCA|nr:uncharacterized protein DFJ58DRAFT_843474 [Suillus subalutaceus]KAG1846395.1 hypothetical protein DFJ58DRAFT_843474 [Suillus subalutaceus]
MKILDYMKCIRIGITALLPDKHVWGILGSLGRIHRTLHYLKNCSEGKQSVYHTCCAVYETIVVGMDLLTNTINQDYCDANSLPYILFVVMCFAILSTFGAMPGHNFTHLYAIQCALQCCIDALAQKVANKFAFLRRRMSHSLTAVNLIGNISQGIANLQRLVMETSMPCALPDVFPGESAGGFIKLQWFLLRGDVDVDGMNPDSLGTSHSCMFRLFFLLASNLSG